jgi:hypothetical protein
MMFQKYPPHRADPRNATQQANNPLSAKELKNQVGNTRGVPSAAT